MTSKQQVGNSARRYAQVRNLVAPLGPLLSRIGPLRRLVRNLDRRVMPTGDVLVETVHGWPIWLDAGDQAVARSIIGAGDWQPEEAALIAGSLPVGGVAIDVGANVGFMTGIMASKVGSDGHVLAFEPDQVNHRLLSRTVESNGWRQVRVVHGACGATPGQLTLYRDPDNWGNHSLALDASLHSGEATTVPVVALDSYADQLTRLDVVKVDVQGWELAVLQGAQALKPLKPTIFVEFYPHGLEQAGVEPDALWQELCGWGSIFQIHRDGTTMAAHLADVMRGADSVRLNVDLVVRPHQAADR